MGIAGYGVSVTTLEEVFLRVGHGSDEVSDDNTAGFGVYAAAACCHKASFVPGICYLVSECLAMRTRETCPQYCSMWWVFHTADNLSCKLLSTMERGVVLAVDDWPGANSVFRFKFIDQSGKCGNEITLTFCHVLLLRSPPG